MNFGLRECQLEAIDNMHNGCVLCGDVGSGKSRTAIGYYYIQHGGKFDNTKKYFRMNSPRDLYIVTTAHKRDTQEWEEEASIFMIGYECTYDIRFVIDSWNNISKYVGVKDAFFIFDEQRVVGRGVWVKSFLKIAKSNEWILLSATPGDAWSDYVPLFIANGFYKNFTEFSKKHIIYSRYCTKYPKIEGYVDTGILIKHQRDILVDIDLKRDTVRYNDDVYVSYDKDKYKDIIRNRWNYFKNEPIETASELCLALRRVVNTDISRQLAVLQIFENHPKVIIFYNFNYELEILKSLTYGTGVEIAEWNGKKHEPIPDSESWVYLVQYTAGAEGWNCIKTDTIIFFSQNYSYKVMKQASGRIDRLNTPFTALYYYHLKTRSGIDLAISKAIEGKKQFNERLYVKKHGY